MSEWLNYHLEAVSLPSILFDRDSLQKSRLKNHNGCHSGGLSVHALHDLSTAFDTVDHIILIQRLHISYHVKGTALC